MIQLIVGEKGKGKTKIILDKANGSADTASGNVVFLDCDNSHMYELKNSIRLINSSEYYIENAEEFAGFVAGIISADHDLQELFIDRILKVAKTDEESVFSLLEKIDRIAEKNSVKVTISVSVTKEQLPEQFKTKVVCAL